MKRFIGADFGILGIVTLERLSEPLHVHMHGREVDILYDGYLEDSGIRVHVVKAGDLPRSRVWRSAIILCEEDLKVQ